MLQPPKTHAVANISFAMLNIKNDVHVMHVGLNGRAQNYRLEIRIVESGTDSPHHKCCGSAICETPDHARLRRSPVYLCATACGILVGLRTCKHHNPMHELDSYTTSCDGVMASAERSSALCVVRTLLNASPPCRSYSTPSAASLGNPTNCE